MLAWMHGARGHDAAISRSRLVPRRSAGRDYVRRKPRSSAQRSKRSPPPTSPRTTSFRRSHSSFAGRCTRRSVRSMKGSQPSATGTSTGGRQPGGRSACSRKRWQHWHIREPSDRAPNSPRLDHLRMQPFVRAWPEPCAAAAVLQPGRGHVRLWADDNCLAGLARLDGGMRPPARAVSGGDRQPWMPRGIHRPPSSELPDPTRGVGRKLRMPQKRCGWATRSTRSMRSRGRHGCPTTLHRRRAIRHDMAPCNPRATPGGSGRAASRNFITSIGCAEPTVAAFARSRRSALRPSGDRRTRSRPSGAQSPATRVFRCDTWANYAAIFDGRTRDRLVCDFTPAYATLDDATVADIVRTMPDVRVIFALRDPVTRAVPGRSIICRAPASPRRRNRPCTRPAFCRRTKCAPTTSRHARHLAAASLRGSAAHRVPRRHRG